MKMSEITEVAFYAVLAENWSTVVKESKGLETHGEIHYYTEDGSHLIAIHYYSYNRPNVTRYYIADINF